MVAVAQTVVDERAMVVEMFDAPIADRAVERSLGFYHLAVGAQIVEVKSDFEGMLDEALIVVDFGLVAGLERHRQDEER